MSPAPAPTQQAERQPGPELVTTAAVPLGWPEQLPLLRMLEVVRQRVESIHRGQQAAALELKEIRRNLPLQRRPLSPKTQEIHVRATWARRNGYCPACSEVQVCTELSRLDGAEYDHAFSRNQDRVTQTWLGCRDCNRKMLDSE